MFRVSGTVRKGSKTVIYRHHFLFRCSLYLQYCSREDGEVMSGSVEAVRATLDQDTLELASCTHPATARREVSRVSSDWQYLALATLYLASCYAERCFL